LFELFARAAERDPEVVAVVCGASSLGYGALRERAQSVAATLLARDIRRFAVLEADATTLLALLGGASLAGVEACVYPPTASSEMVAEFMDRFDHTVLVTSSPGLVPDERRVDPAELVLAEPVERPLPDVRPHLVLTTGTTGAPRAVRHDWSRLVGPVLDTPSGSGQRWLLAYGMNQFGGLQVLLHVMAAGATLVATEEFVPRQGLLAAREHGVTHASATPTYWRFLLAELRSDGGAAPGLRQITLGGEAVPAAVLDELGRIFPAARVTQIYAANEFGKALSVRDAEHGLPVAELIGADGVELKVEDGELWVRTPYGMLGYYGEDADDSTNWRRTGDLVEVVGGRVHFRGRVSEVINVGGVKVHPLPVEERIDTLPGVDLVRVFGRPNALTGAVVAVEIVAAPGTDTDALGRAVREACADLPPASRPRSIKFVSEIATTGAKVVRNQHRVRNQTRETNS